jgi:thiamine biosynthesis lipoprotein
VKKVLLVLWVVLVVVSCAEQKQEVHLTGPTMGTTYNVKYVPSEQVAAVNLQGEIEQRLVEINQLMSTYISDSELSQFNQWQSTEIFPLSKETLFVMAEAKRLGLLSDGVLDVTVGPLVNIWGFGPNSRPEKIPSKQQIVQVRDVIGLDKLRLTDTGASKVTPNLYVDLSTIAKGYGVDQLAEILLSYGVNNFLVEIGGEMRLSGVKLSGQPWRVAIEKPETHVRSVQKIISVGNNAVATSGDYRNYYEEGGMRYSHLINPTTGYPIQHNLVSVTVVHPSSMTADGLATALNVMGKEKAVSLVEENGLAVLLITKEKDSFKEYTSPKFDELVTVH